MYRNIALIYQRIETHLPVTAVRTCPEAPQFCAIALLDGSIQVYQLDLPKYPLVMATR